jgi:hypothetical protein
LSWSLLFRLAGGQTPRQLRLRAQLFEIFESIDQEYYIYELERQILSSPTREDFAAVYEMRMMNIFRSFSTGEYDPEIYNRYLADLLSWSLLFRLAAGKLHANYGSELKRLLYGHRE